MFSFGTNEYGELGLGHMTSVTTPTFISKLKDIAIYRIACGRNHSAAIDGKEASRERGREGGSERGERERGGQ